MVVMLCAVLLQSAQHVLYAHNRIVDQAANRNRETTKGHRVDRLPEILEDQRRHEDGHRNRGERDDRRAQGAEKKEEDCRNEHRCANQLTLERADRCLDESRLPEGHLRRIHPGRERYLHLFERGFDRASQVNGVRRRLLLNAEDDGRLALEARIPPFGRRCEGHGCDLTQQDRLAISRSDREVLQILQARGPTEMADEIFAPVQFEKAPRGVRREASNRPFQLLQRNTELSHTAGVGLNLELPHLPANRDDLRDAGDRHQARTKNPVRILSDLHRRDLRRVDRDRDLHDLAHDRADRPHARNHVFRQPFLHG